jgi:hypothetical protein
MATLAARHHRHLLMADIVEKACVAAPAVFPQNDILKDAVGCPHRQL